VIRFDFGPLSPAARFEVVTATIVPRPIALITSLDATGRLNVAPYSFFAPITIDPPLLVLGVLAHTEGRLKDTGLNVLKTGELVVNLVPVRISQEMNLTCIDAPPGVDEAALAGLAIAPSERVAPPRLAQSPVTFECRLHQAIDVIRSIRRLHSPNSGSRCRGAVQQFWTDRVAISKRQAQG